jgi:hypothetical protein
VTKIVSRYGKILWPRCDFSFSCRHCWRNKNSLVSANPIGDCLLSASNRKSKSNRNRNIRSSIVSCWTLKTMSVCIRSWREALACSSSRRLLVLVWKSRRRPGRRRREVLLAVLLPLDPVGSKVSVGSKTTTQVPGQLQLQLQVAGQVQVSQICSPTGVRRHLYASMWSTLEGVWLG